MEPTEAQYSQSFKQGIVGIYDIAHKADLKNQ